MSEPEPKIWLPWYANQEANQLINDHLELQDMTPEEIRRYSGGR